jgi:hypothetical protein
MTRWWPHWWMCLRRPATSILRHVTGQQNKTPIGIPFKWFCSGYISKHLIQQWANNFILLLLKKFDSTIWRLENF